ncbi:NAD(P)/FAD-dependent oxidoreductase [Loktanella sp. DJP18]|uniref:NAD(P)/FAD-dependent oxidoreductase n=1 Tax=Loktanella sp. DJP18 TaxID=3409788 RepID=UPI003BB4A4E9
MTDFIVVGGGVAGISAAARLSHLGHVTLLEAEAQTGYHSSARSAALFEENYGKPTTRALNAASREFHQTANGGVLSPRNVMLVGSAADADAFAHDLTDMRLEPITGTEARAMVPILTDRVDRAGWHAQAWDIDTDRLIQNWLRELRGNGGTIVTDARVTAVTRESAGWHVTTPQGEVSGAVLVNATGAWADRIAALAGVTPLGLTPYRRSMARLAAPGGHDVSGWPMIFGAGEAWYAKPDAGALLVSPADEDPVEPHDAFADDMVLAEGLARYQDHVTEAVTRPIATWAGLRTFAPDRQLVLGRAVDAPDFIWCAGQGGYGFQTAPAASALIADIVAQRVPEVGVDLAAALSPARFG